MSSNNICGVNKTVMTSSCDANNLFKEYCPSEKGMIIADFAKNIMEIHESKYAKCLRIKGFEDNLKNLSQKILDPTQKLQKLFQKQKIECVKANAPINEAEIIFLDDTFHGNKEQTLIRGEIANALKDKENIFLCEGVDQGKIVSNINQIQQALAPNIEFDISKDLCLGWDDAFIQKQSLEKIRMGLFTVNLATQTNNLSNESNLLNVIDDLSQVSFVESHQRTESEWKEVLKIKDLYPKLKVIVFGGGGHNNEIWLQDKLKNSKYKFAIITPKKCQDISKTNMIENGIKYYHVNTSNPWAI